MPLRVLLKHVAIVGALATPYIVLLMIFAAEVFGDDPATLGMARGS